MIFVDFGDIEKEIGFFSHPSIEQFFDSFWKKIYRFSVNFHRLGGLEGVPGRFADISDELLWGAG